MISEKLKLLPDNPGCYLMKNANGDIIYVGKAKNLKNRVTTYFTGSHDTKTTQLVAHIADFDFILTNTEKEALLLEANLIKKHRPFYNIDLMDDKSYPYIKISYEKYPTVTVVRELKTEKRATYFGPYPSATSAHKTVEIINELFPTKKCKKLPKKVCLYYHLGQCWGMCQFPVDEAAYQKMITEITALLKNGSKELKNYLNKTMETAAKQENYEVAAACRDYLSSLQYIADKQSVATLNMADCDIINYGIASGFIAFQVLLVRDKMLLEKVARVYPYFGNLQDDFQTFLQQYQQMMILSDEIIVPAEITIDNFEKVKQFKSSRYDALLQMAAKNATQAIINQINSTTRRKSIANLGSIQLQEILKTEVNRIEMFDNSHLAGSNNVSAMIVNLLGEFKKDQYRLYKLTGYQDDLSSFREVLYRRYFKALQQDNAQPCDLLLIDGGLAQVKVAKEIRDSMNFKFPILGLVKNERHKTTKVLDEQGKVISFAEQPEAFLFLTQLQEEVHRFVISYQTKLRSKALTLSILDDCPGIGESRKALLLGRFKNINKLKQASLTDIQKVIGKKTGQIVFDFLRQG